MRPPREDEDSIKGAYVLGPVELPYECPYRVPLPFLPYGRGRGDLRDEEFARQEVQGLVLGQERSVRDE